MNNQIQTLTRQLHKKNKEDEMEVEFQANLEEELNMSENIQSNTFSHLLETHTIGSIKSKLFFSIFINPYWQIMENSWRHFPKRPQ